MSQAHAVTDLSRPIMYDDPYPTFARLRESAPVSRAKSSLRHLPLRLARA